MRWLRTYRIEIELLAVCIVVGLLTFYIVDHITAAGECVRSAA